MIKILSILMVLSLAFSGCSNATPSPASESSAPVPSEAQVSSESISATESSEQSISVDDGGDIVAITLPSSMFSEGDMNDFDTDSYVKEQGFISANVNDDGSVSITMTKSRHEEVMSEYAKEVEDTFKDMCHDDSAPYIEEILHSDDFKEFTVRVDRAGYEAAGFDFSEIAIELSAKMYQAFSGGDGTGSIIYVDVETGDTIKTIAIE